MNKNYLIVMLALVCNFAMAQIEPTTYRGAFAPNVDMWTKDWTNWTPNSEAYTDAATVVQVTADITVNTTWTTGKTYYLNNLIYVKNNATLTIQPGVIVKGNYSSTGTALVITKGAKINAVGTAANPIVFTSAKAAGTRAGGDWGGIILLGKAGFNQNNGVNNIEGITASVNTEYGGGTTPNDADNSGTLKYVRIEFGGYVFSPNNEINGLTFGAVGSGTTIDYVQVSYAGDDSFEWFGGAVNCKHLVAYKGLDDDLDTDNGYKGVVQFALCVRDPNIADNPTISTSEGFESDNNAGTLEAATGYSNTTAIFTNCTMVGPSKRQATVAAGYSRALRLRRSTELKIYNSIFLDFKNNYAGLTDEQTIAKYYAGKLKLKNNIFAGFYGSDFTDYPKGVNPKTYKGTANTNTIGGLAANTNFDLGAKMTTDGNTTFASSNGVLTKAYNTTLSDYTDLDYRPGTDAATGASFTDASMLPYIVNPAEGDVPTIANVSYCKGAVASPLTAALSATGLSLKWYTAATGGLGATTAPTPATSLVGEKTYYVSQITAVGESARVALKVTVNALPTEVVGTITGTGPDGSSAVAIGKYVGTTAAFTYTVPAFTDNTLSYLWTVPNGAVIKAGQGTNTITVNYSLEPAGAGSVGTISVVGVNASACKTAAKTLALSKVLPTAPASIKLFLGTSTTAITNYGKYMGTTTPLTLTAATTATADSYQWELPAGVNVAMPTGTAATATTTTYYTAEPFISPAAMQPSTSSPPSGTGAAVGLKYWAVTERTYTYDVKGVATTTKIATAEQKILGSDRTWTFKISTGAAGDRAKNTYFTYDGQRYKLTTATDANSTSVVGTNVGAVANYPVVSSAGTSITGSLAFEAGVTTAIAFTKITLGGYFATTTQAYAPFGTRVRTNLPSILINFAGVTNAATTKLYLGVKSVNGSGISVTKNATNTDVVAMNAVPGLFYNTYTETWVAPNADTLVNATSVYNITGTTPSTAKLLMLTATLPAAAGAVVGTLKICSSKASNITYTITAAALNATVYNITAPANCTINGGTNTATIDATAAATFTVNYPAGFTVSTATPKSISIQSQNGIGFNTTANKVLVLTNVGADCTTVARIAAPKASVSATEVYPNPVSSDFNIDVTAAKAGAFKIAIYSLDNNLVASPRALQLQEGANAINENVSSLKKGIYIVRLVNDATGEVITKKLVKN